LEEKSPESLVKKRGGDFGGKKNERHREWPGTKTLGPAEAVTKNTRKGERLRSQEKFFHGKKNPLSNKRKGRRRKTRKTIGQTRKKVKRGVFNSERPQQRPMSKSLSTWD